MKMLVVGSSALGALESFLLSHFENDHRIDQIILHDTRELSENLSIKQKLIRKLSPNWSPMLDGFNRSLLQSVDSHKPQVVLVFKGMELYPSTLEEISRGAFLVNYNPDHPFIYSGRGSGNRNMSRSIRYYKLYLTYDMHAKAALSKMAVNSELVPFGFQDSDRFEQPVAQEEEVLRCCFIGNSDRNRIGFLRDVASELELDIYGAGWASKDFSPTTRVFPGVYGQELYSTLRKYRVQINLMRPHNPDSHNMRSFDIPGCGGIALMPDTTDHRKFFCDKDNVFLYRDLTEAKELALKLLSLDYPSARNIRVKARKKSKENGFSYENRATLILDYIEKQL